MSILISLESLRIANATIDVMQSGGVRFPLAFAERFCADAAALGISFAIGEAVIVGADLIASLQLMATHFTITPVEAISPALHHAASRPDLRASIDRAFVAAFRQIVPASGRAMTVNAWRELLSSFLDALDEA